MTVDDLIEQARNLPPGERAAFLDRECPDAAIRARVEAVLAVDATRTFGDPAATGSHHDGPPIEAEGALIAGRYKLRQQIGEGGMGTVWMADQIEPVKRRVAVKLIRVERGQSKTVLARFEAERQAIALMDHPNIAKLLDAGTTDDGSPFFVMELVKGVPLNEYCDQHKLTIPDRLGLFLKICSAVQHAHQKGIIHRDLKPGNILVESHDGKPVPKVIDFGLAKATTGLQLTEQSMFTAFGSVMGTPLYMAPEQANFNAVDVDTRADVYALGVILYELLTGTTPITRQTLEKAALDELLRLVREQEAPTPSSRLSSADGTPSVAASRRIEPRDLGRFVKGELDWIVMKALAKERDRRYETANGFARDVERFLNHEPVQAGPPSAAYRFKKFVRRNRGQVIAAGVVLLTLVAGLLGTAWQAYRAEAARADEAVQRDLAEKKSTEARQAQSRAEAGERLAEQRLLDVEAEKRKVEQERQISTAVKDFLQRGLLAQADTRTQANTLLKGGGSAESAKFNPTIRELLDRAVVELAPDRIEGNFPDQPLVQAELLRTVGNAYNGVGEYASAVELLTRSLRLFEKHHPADHLEILHNLNDLALAHQNAGQFPRAVALYDDLLQRVKATRGPDHPYTTTGMSNLALAYRVSGQLGKAIPLFEEALRLQKATLEPNHPETLRTMGNLAVGYKNAGQLEKAIPLFEETLQLQKATLGADHPSTLSTMNNLGEAYREAKQLDRAIALNEETLQLAKEKLGPEHPNTLISTSNLALAYRDAGQVDKALPLLEETFRLMKVNPGPNHPQTLLVMSNLANTYQAAGQLEKALPLYEESLKLRQVAVGWDHPSTLTSMNNLAEAYRAAGRLDKATTLHEETLHLIKPKLGRSHPNTVGSMNNLARVYEAANRYPPAEDLRREVVAIQKEKAPSTAYTGSLAALGRNLLGQKKWAEAEPYLRESLEGGTKAQPEAWTTFYTHTLLGEALLGQKKYAEAEPLLLKGYEGMKARDKAIGAQAATRIAGALDRLVELYTATDVPDKVKQYQELRAKYPDPKEVAPMP